MAPLSEMSADASAQASGAGIHKDGVVTGTSSKHSERRGGSSRSPKRAEKSPSRAGKSPKHPSAKTDAPMPPADVTGRGEKDKHKGKGKGKRKREGPTAERIDELTLMLRLAATVSKHQAYLVGTFMLPIDSHIAERAIEKEAAYKDETKGNKGHGLGKPDAYIFKSILDECTVWAKHQNPVNDDVVAAVAEYFEFCPYEDYKKASHAIDCCRAGFTYNKDRVRLTLRLADDRYNDEYQKQVNRAASVLVKVMLAEGAMHTEGAAPKSQSERNIQKVVERIIKEEEW